MPLSIIELREYTLHPGKRDTLIDLFDREFVHTQEAVGIRVLGQFRDLNRPDRFVWLRGFTSMAQRAEALAAFYGGPVWKQHRNAANATMIDSDNVLLLQPAWDGSASALESHSSLGTGPTLVANVCSFVSSDSVEAFAELFRRELQPSLLASEIPVLASLKTEPAKNTFPALPVREGEHTFVWLSGFLEPQTFTTWSQRGLITPKSAGLAAPQASFFLSPTEGSKLKPLV